MTFPQEGNTETPTGGVSIVVNAHARLRGDVDLEALAPLSDVFMTVIPSIARLDIYLSEVTFMDSSGLTLLLRVHQAVQARGASLYLHGPTPELLRLFQLTKLDSVFNLVTDLGDEAAARIQIRAHSVPSGQVAEEHHIEHLGAFRNELTGLLAVALQHDVEHVDEVQRVQALDDAAVGSLEQALVSRDLIGQAKGIIMATMSCSTDEAFALLVRQSRHENRKLVVVATEIADCASRRRAIEPMELRTTQERDNHFEPPAGNLRDDIGARDEQIRELELQHVAESRTVELDRVKQGVDARRVVDDRDRTAEDRDHIADARDRTSEIRDENAEARDDRAARREATSDDVDPDAVSDRAGARRDRQGGAGDRKDAEHDRGAASTDRALSARERALSVVDALTGAHRRDAGIVELDREIQRAKRAQQTYVLAFADVDGLKSTNDALGHAAGDQLLCHVVDSIRRHVRASDLIVRFGGDEFLCGLPNVGVAEAAERFGLVNADLRATRQASVTIGIAELKSNDNNDNVEDLIARADKALYRARQQQAQRP